MLTTGAFFLMMICQPKKRTGFFMPQTSGFQFMTSLLQRCTLRLFYVVFFFSSLCSD